MRPLRHPPADSITLTGVLHALSDPARLAIVSRLLDAPQGLSCIEAASCLDESLPKSTCSQHFQILREAGLIRTERVGVEHSNSLRRDDIESRFPGLLQSVLGAWKREHTSTRRRRRRAMA